MLHASARSTVPLDENALTRALRAKRAAGRSVLDLTCTNPTELGLSLDSGALSALFAGVDAARYEPEPFGELRARSAVAAHLSATGPHVAAENVLLSASTSEAYTFLFKLLCDPGDDVLVPAPSYPLFDALARLEGVELRPYPLRFHGEWSIDLGALTAARGPRTRALITVHPNNPTGSFVRSAELDALAELELPIISDEVFASYRDAGCEAPRTLAELAERALVFRLGGLSKELLLPQLKLAWTALSGPADALASARARLEHIADAYLSVGTPVQHALPALLTYARAQHVRVTQRVSANERVLRGALAGSAADVLPIEGGAMAIVRLPALIDDERFCLELLQHADTMVQPGYFYDLHGMCTCVLSLLVETETLRSGARALRQRVDALVHAG